MSKNEKLSPATQALFDAKRKTVAEGKVLVRPDSGGAFLRRALEEKGMITSGAPTTPSKSKPVSR
jgi:hypothetical protein